MEAPEKICVSTDSFGWLQAYYCENHPPIVEEYVHKDAFIEKACVKLKKLMYDNLMFQGRLHREEVIDNFVEDFKNRMKGE